MDSDKQRVEVGCVAAEQEWVSPTVCKGWRVTYRPNGFHLGDLVAEDDGFHVFLPSGYGAWGEPVLHDLAEVMREIDKEWLKQQGEQEEFPFEGLIGN